MLIEYRVLGRATSDDSGLGATAPDIRELGTYARWITACGVGPSGKPSCTEPILVEVREPDHADTVTWRIADRALEFAPHRELSSMLWVGDAAAATQTGRYTVAFP